MKRKSTFLLVSGVMIGVVGTLGLQPAIGHRWQQDRPQDGGPPGFGFPGFGPPGGPGGGPGGPGAKDIELVKEFDANDDGWLNAQERAKAKEKLATMPAQGRGPGGRGRGGRGGQGTRGGQGGGPSGFGPPGGGPGGPPQGGPPGGLGFPGGPGGPGGEMKPAEPGRALKPADVEQYSDQSLYDSQVLRTIFIDFDDVTEWDSELATFKPTDVDVPATVTVDGKSYPKVGVKYRGNSSYGMVPAGYNKSLNLSFDLADKDQSLLGYRTLNLLNCAGDGSLLSSVLYSQVAGPYMAVPKANMVRVVINGECWGLYANVQQFNKDFLEEAYGESKGARWKVPGRPGSDGGLRYVGENIADYESRFEIKSKDRQEDWQALINLCKVLEETPAAELPAALEGLLDIDQLLWFLAVDNASVNSDGYWTRASDYSIYRDTSGEFHLSPYDMNEAFMTAQHGPPGGRGPGGPGGRGPGGRGGRGPDGFGPPGPPPEDPFGLGFLGFGPGPGGPEGPVQDRPAGNDTTEDQLGGRRGNRAGRGFGRPGGPGGPGGRGPGGPMDHGSVDLDPLSGLEDSNKPLRSKILAVPQWREQYLANIKTLAEREFDWQKIGPFIQAYRELLEVDVRLDTRRQSPVEAFFEATGDEGEKSLKSFFEKRRKYLLSQPAVEAVKVESRSALHKHQPRKTKPSAVEPVLPTQPTAKGLVINEILAQPAKQDKDAPDWIELFNGSDHMIDLSEYSLTDEAEEPTRWTFPAGSSVPSQGFALVFADDQAEGEGWHANFKLSKKGEPVLLTRRTGSGIQIIDRVDFPVQRAGVSFGRFPNYSGTWQPLSPTPGKPNRDSE